MTYRQLTDNVAARIGDPKAQVARVCDILLAEIVEQLRNSAEVSLPGLGKFKIANRPARDGHNPATGEKIKIAARRRARFTEAGALKEALNPVRLTGARRRA
jgi:DNA-binding protein HU-beta